VWDQFDTVASGVGQTVAVTLLSFALGALLGIPLVAGIRSRWFPLRAVARFLVDLLRAVPPLVWLFLLFYGLAEYVVLAPYPAAVLGLGMVSSAYMCEIYRSGLLGVRRQQWEAASALGLNRRQAMASVIGPQALRLVLPGAAGWAIALLKETAVVSIIGVHDITFRAQTEARSSAEGLQVFAIAGILYIALSIPIAILARWADARVARAVAR
jgi:polar amino acid transport system permease protein